MHPVLTGCVCEGNGVQDELEVMTEDEDIASQLSGPLEAPEPAPAEYEVRWGPTLRGVHRGG